MRLLSRSLPLATALLALLPGAAPAAAVPGEVIVRYEPGATRAERAAVQRGTGTGRALGLPGGSRRLEVVDGETVAETVAELQRRPGVAVASPNLRFRAAFVPNDPGFGGGFGGWRGTQWNFVGPASVNAPAAWDVAIARGVPGGRGVVVAVVDSGVAYRTIGRFRRAPDLYANRFVPGYDFLAKDRLPLDESGHGTHITGTIAQATNNRRGVTGLAYGVKIMPVRVLDGRGFGDTVTISRGIRFAAARGADVINVSIELEDRATASQVPEIVSAVRYARRRA